MRNSAQTNKMRKIRCLAMLAFLCLATGHFLTSPPTEKIYGARLVATPTPRVRTRTRRPAQPPKPRKYSEFPHDIRPHQKSCDSCHKFPTANWRKVRSRDAFPDVTDFPTHDSCLSCHRQQFFKGTPPAICSICHTNPGPRESTRRAFPNPREIFDLTARGKRAISDFGVNFPHEKHLDLIGANNNLFQKSSGGAFYVKAGKTRAAAEESCAVCHQTLNPQGDSDLEYLTKPPAKLGDEFWIKKGTFKSVPTSHGACFTCHSAETGILPAPTSCATCHELAPKEPKADFDARLAATMGVDERATLLAWRKRDASGKFRHEFFSHSELACATCHTVSTMNTTDPLTKKVKVMSCGGEGSGCHITPTSDDGGILNFEVDARKTNANFQCVKCHLTFGQSAVPESHTKAISDLSGK